MGHKGYPSTTSNRPTTPARYHLDEQHQVSFSGSANWLTQKSKMVSHSPGLHERSLATRIYNQFDRCSHRAADRVVTVCNDFAEELQRRGVSNNQIRLLHNPIRSSAVVPEGERLRLRADLGLSGGTLVLLSLGRISAEKDTPTSCAPRRPRGVGSTSAKQLAAGTSLTWYSESTTHRFARPGRFTRVCGELCRQARQLQYQTSEDQLSWDSYHRPRRSCPR